MKKQHGLGFLCTCGWLFLVALVKKNLRPCTQKTAREITGCFKKTKIPKGSCHTSRPGTHALIGKFSMALLVAALLMAASPARAIEWTYWNVEDGAWEEAANWNPARVPGAGTLLVHIDNNGIARIGAGVTAKSYELDIGYSPYKWGRLLLTDGGTAMMGSSTNIGDSTNSLGTVVVDGADSLLSSNLLYVGRNGEGRLLLTDGGKATASGDTILGTSAGSIGVMTVDGVGSVYTADSYFWVADQGVGRLTLTGGGKVLAGANLVFRIAGKPGSEGTVTVGQGASLVCRGSMVIGGGLADNVIVLYGQGMLAGTGTVTLDDSRRSVTMYSTATLSAGDRPGELGTLTIEGKLEFRDGGTFRVDLKSNNRSDKIHVTGSYGGLATIPNNAIIAIDASRLCNGDFTILTADLGISSISYPPTKFTVNGESLTSSTNPRAKFVSGTLVKTTNSQRNLILKVAASDSNYKAVANDIIRWTGQNETNGIGAWNLSTQNWSHTTGHFLDGDTVTFVNNAKTDANNGHTITLGGNGKTVADMYVEGTQNWTFVGDILADGGLSTLNNAAGRLTMRGAGTLRLKGENTFVGGVELLSGVLVLEREWNLGTTLSGLRFISNAGMAGTALGTLRVADGKKLSFYGTSVDNQRIAVGESNRPQGGAVVLGNNASLTIAGNKVASVYGGALNVQKSSSFALTAGTGARFYFERNQSEHGGAVWNNGTLAVGRADFILNQATGGQRRGGAVYNTGAEGLLTFTDAVLFNQNNANQGGAIYADGGVVTAQGEARFTANSATTGGALYVMGAAQVNLSSGGLFTNNTATTLGGAIYTDGGVVTAQGEARFTANSASSGGALYVTDAAQVNLSSGGLFTNNTATTLGGAVYQDARDAGNGVNIQDTTFRGNTARAGGAYYLREGNLALTDVVFDGNRASTSLTTETGGAYGGALYLAGPAASTQATFHNVTFTDNQATTSETPPPGAYLRGGALYMESGSATFTGGTEFAGNRAYFAGAGVMEGGAIYYAGGALDFDGATTFQSNHAGTGGAIHTAADLDLSDSSGGLYFNANTAGGSGGGIYSSSASSSSVILNGNTYFSGNLAGRDGGAIYQSAGTASGGLVSIDTTAGAVAFSGNRSGVTFVSGTPDSATGTPNAIHLAQNTKLELKGNGNIYFNDPISSGSAGGNSLAKTGSGFVQFMGASVLNPDSAPGGEVKVSGGTFRVVSDARFSTGGNDNQQFILESGGTLAGAGTIASKNGFVISGTISPDADRFEIPEYVTGPNNFKPGSVTVAADKNIGTLALVGATTFNNATLAVDLDSASSYDKVTVDGNLTYDGTTVIDLGNFRTGTYTGIVSTTGTMGALGSYEVKVNNAALGARQKAEAVVAPKSLNLTLSDGYNLNLTLSDGYNLNLTWRGGTGNWNTSTANWNYGPVAANRIAFQTNDYVTFDGSSAGTVTVQEGGVTVSGMHVSGGTHTFKEGGITGINAGENGQTVTGTLKVDNGAQINIANSVSFVGGLDNGGTVQLEGTGSFTGDIKNDGTLMISRNDYTLENKISGSGTIRFDRSTTLTIAGDAAKNNTFQHQSGNVHLTGTWHGAYNQDGATGVLYGSGTIAGAATLKGTVNPAALGGVGTISLGNLTLDNATIALDIDASGASDKIVIVATGTATFTGTNTIKTNFAEGITLGDYVFMTGTDLADPNGKFTLELGSSALDGYNLFARGSGVTRNAAETELTLRVALDNIDLTWNGTANSIWTNNAADENSGSWTNNNAANPETKFRNGDSVTFDAAATNKTVNVTNNVSVADMTVTGGDYTFTGIGGISSGTSGKLVVNGGSTAAFSNSGTNNFVDGTQIDSGATVQIGSNGNLGGDIENYGTLEIFRSGAYTLDNKISGSGTTKMVGAGTLTIGGDGDSQSNAFHQAAGIVNLTKRWNGNYTQAGGILTGDGTIEGKLVSAKDLRPGNETTLGTLNVTEDADFSDATLRFKVDGTNSDKIEVGGKVTISEGGKTTTIDILNFTPNPHVTYTLLTGVGDLWNDENDFTTLVGGSAPSGRQTITYDNSDKTAVKVTLTSSNNVSLRWNGDNGNLWRDANKWTATNPNDETFIDGDTVTFGAGNTHSIGLGTSDVTVESMTVEGGDYTFTGEGVGIRTNGTGTEKLDVQSGTVTLANTGTSNFTGGIDIAANATLQLGKANNGGTLDSGVAITNAGTLQFNRSDDFTFANAITNAAGTVSQSGSGTVRLNGSQTGKLEQTAGTIHLAGTWTGNFTQTAGTLTGNGILTGTSTLKGTVAPTGTLTLQQNADFNNATIRIDHLGADNDGTPAEATDQVVVTGIASFTGTTNKVDFYEWANGSYILVSAGSITGTVAANFTDVLYQGAALTGRMDAELEIDNNQLILTTSKTNDLRTWTGTSNDQWNETAINWDEGDKLFLDGDRIVFGDSGVVTRSEIFVAGVGMKVADMEVNVTGTNSYTFGGGEITTTDNTTLADATGKLVKKGGGTVTFNNANDFTKGTDLEGGRIVLGNDEALGTQQIRMDAGTSLAFSGDRTISNEIQLKGAVTFDTGSGQTTLNGMITENAGNFGFTKKGTGTLTLTGANTFTGSILVSEGTLTGTTSSILGDVLLDGPETTFIFDQNINGTWGGNLSSNEATANVIKRGSGALTVLGDGSNFSGSTTIEAGTLVLQSANAVGAGTEIVNNATLRADFAGTLSNVLKGAGTLVIDKAVTLNRENADFTGEIKVNPSNSLTLDYATAVDLKNLLSGSGSVTKTGIGKLTLSGANTNTNTGTFTQSTGDVHLVSNWAGDYTQNAGTTFTSADGATISGRAAFSGSLALDGNLNVGSLVFDGATIAFDMGTDLFTVRSGGLTFSGSNTLKASFASGIQVGTYDIAVVTGGGTIADPGAWSYSLGSTLLDGYNLDARGSGIIASADGKKLQLRVALDNIDLTWNGTDAAGGNLWTNNPSNDTVGNWTNGQAGSLLETKFRDGDSVRFDNSAGQKQVSIGAAVAVGSMTVDNASYTFTGTGGITSASNLVLQNNASAILANEGSNTFSGTSIENGSTLQIGNANASGNLSGAIFNEGTFVINRSDDYTLDNTVSGTGLTKMAGTGTLTISGANSQSNAFEQASGTVNLQKAWAGDYTQSGGLLTGNGTISGNLVSAKNINPDGTLSITGTANLSGTTLGIRNATDTLAVTGSVSLGNGAGITTIDILNFQTGTYTLVTASDFGGANIDENTFKTLVGGGSLTGRQTVDYTQSTAKAIIMKLNTEGANLELTWAGADGDSWRAANKWTASGSPETFADGDALSFDASVATPQTINLGTGTNHVAWMNVNGGDFTFTGTGGINGTDEASATTLGNPSGKLAVSGNASLTFANTGSNAFAGGTEIASGSLLTLGLNDASGNLSGDIVNEGVFAINRSDAYTLDNTISGAGRTQMTGTGTLTISGANSQSNAFEQSSGTVNLQKTWTGSYTQTGGVLTGNGSVAGHAEISGTIAPTGTLSLSSATFYGGSTISIGTLGTDMISVTGATTFDVTNGKIKVDLGTWTLGTGTILDDSIADTLDIGATFDGVTLNGQALSGRQTAGLSIENGNLVLTATASNMVRTWTGGNGNSWDKNTTESWQEDDKKFIDGDKVVFDATGALVPAITVSENLTASEMTVDGNVNYTFGGASITTDASAWSGTGTASGKLVKNGTGTATFNNANDFKGGVDLNEGRINIGNNTALGAQEIRMADGTTLGFAGDHTISNPVALTGDATVDTGSNNALMTGKIGGAYTLTKDGLGTLTLDAVNEHGATNISAGRLIAKQAASLGSGNANIGSGATLELDFSDELTNSVSGGGALENKGDIVLSGDHTQFTGTIFVRSGKTTLGDGFHSGGAFDISSTLTGSGQMGDALVVRTGAKLSPGDGGFGTITTGSLTFESGSIYEVEVEPGGTGSDLVIVTGTATLAGKVQHIGLPENGGKYSPIGEWTILEAGTLVGKFDEVEAAYNFLEASLLYGTNEVKLRLQRNDVDFASKGRTPNQKSTARGIESQGQGHQPFETVAKQLNTADMERIYDLFSGEMHASFLGELMNQDRGFAKSWKRRLSGKRAGVPGVSSGAFGEKTDFWFSIDGYKNTVDRTSNTSKTELKGWGASLGVEKEVEDWTFGAAFRYGDSEYKVKNLHSKADLDSFNFGLYAGRPLGDFNVKLGAGYGFHQIDSRRSVTFMGENLKADYDAHSFQLFGELGYLKNFGAFSVEPYAGLAWNYAENESFTEKGGASALRAKSESNDNFTSSLGVRAHYKPLEKMRFNADLGWQHLFGDKEPQARFAFTGGNSFTIEGAPMDRDSLGLGLDMDVTIRENLSIRAGYVGRFGEDTDSHAGFVSLEFAF